MKRIKIACLSVLIAAGFGAVLVAPALGQRPSLAMLDQLDRGTWELRSRDASGNVERICLGDARRLIQLRHQAQACQQQVVTDSASEVTVQYTCRGHGYGRTKIRRETNQLVQIDSQGILDGMPFVFTAEGRRVSACGA